MCVCVLLQEIVDARRIRNQILTNFELATQLDYSDPERRKLLHVVIVGGGPTGVEFGAEFYDFFQQVHDFYSFFFTSYCRDAFVK